MLPASHACVAAAHKQAALAHTNKPHSRTRPAVWQTGLDCCYLGSLLVRAVILVRVQLEGLPAKMPRCQGQGESKGRGKGNGAQSRPASCRPS